MTSISRRQLLAGVCALALVYPCGSFAKSRSSQTCGVSVSLNGTWRFALATTPERAAALANFHQPNFNRAAFADTPVPSNWAVLGHEEPQYRDFDQRVASEGFYVRAFELPEDWNLDRVLLHFNGVWASAEIWLNGARLGRHDSGFTSFAFDVTEQLREGVNDLAVRVRQVHSGYKFDTNDDWALGGIYGDVWLEAMPAKRWIDTLHIATTFDDAVEDADLAIRVMIADTHKNVGPGHYSDTGGVPYALSFTLLDAQGVEVTRRTIEVHAHHATSRETRMVFRVAHPIQWNAEKPYLYLLHVDLLESGQPVHRRSQRVGFREISTKGGVFRINGRAVKLRGVNRHEEHPDVGRATNRKHWLEDIRLMKAANINYVRCAHYPPAPGFLDLCDELGMYVGNELPMSGSAMNDPAAGEGAMLRVLEGVNRDINHPSVIYWSIGNEDPLTSLHLAAVRTAKALDPTRPMLLPWRAEDWLPPEIDILAPHYWHPDEYDAIAGGSSRPVISTEYAHAYGPHGMGSLEARWNAIIRHPAGAGAAIWMWADQGIKTLDGSAAGISKQNGLRLTQDGWDGITDSYRRPTRDYWETKAVYAPVRCAVDAVDFVPGQRSASIPICNDYDFTDLDQISIAWQIMEDEKVLGSGTSVIAGEPHSQTELALPLDAIRMVRPGSVYYAWVIFSDTSKGEITRNGVELRNAVPPSATRSVSEGVVRVEDDTGTTLKAGRVAYRFDRSTGTLAYMAIDDRPVAGALQPSLWRPLDDNERYIAGSVANDLPDLGLASPTVRSWELLEERGSVLIRSVVDYVVNAQNRFSATYEQRVAPDGCLHIRYQYQPVVEAPWLPQVGMVLNSSENWEQLRWVGLGPHDAYPNKQAAPIFGLWSNTLATPREGGVKKTRWIELSRSTDMLRITNDGYLYTEGSNPRRVHILSTVLGRPEKGRRPKAPMLRLDLVDSASFAGEFLLQPSVDMIASAAR